MDSGARSSLINSIQVYATFNLYPALAAPRYAIERGLNDVELSSYSAGQCLARKPKVMVGGNAVPFIAFRSLSDLAGGGEGANEMTTFLNIAADSSAKVLLAFLAAWQL